MKIKLKLDEVNLAPIPASRDLFLWDVEAKSFFMHRLCRNNV
ncbi:Uncharacterised protein [Legionella londiniensis]|nr:Uncharacterised protein [Legionella londiniensis]